MELKGVVLVINILKLESLGVGVGVGVFLS